MMVGNDGTEPMASEAAPIGPEARPSRIKRLSGLWTDRLVPSLLFTAVFLGLISLSIQTARGDLALIFIVTVLLLVTIFHYVFNASRFFAMALANLTGIYACLFLFFLESNFGNVGSMMLWSGFLAPLVAFLIGSLWRRRDIRQLVFRTHPRLDRNFAHVLAWLMPIALIGALSFLAPSYAPSQGWLDVAFIVAMLAIAGIILFVSCDVAVFLLDTASLFEDFFQRAARLAAPAFAFLTFYSLLVFVFASAYSLIDGLSGHPQFRVDGVVRAITFPESLYFSLTTLSTVGYGDIAPAGNAIRMLVAIEIVSGILLLLFGFNEIISYSRGKLEHTRQRQNR